MMHECQGKAHLDTGVLWYIDRECIGKAHLNRTFRDCVCDDK